MRCIQHTDMRCVSSLFPQQEFAFNKSCLTVCVGIHESKREENPIYTEIFIYSWRINEEHLCSHKTYKLRHYPIENAVLNVNMINKKYWNLKKHIFITSISSAANFSFRVVFLSMVICVSYRIVSKISAWSNVCNSCWLEGGNVSRKLEGKLIDLQSRHLIYVQKTDRWKHMVFLPRNSSLQI